MKYDTNLDTRTHKTAKIRLTDEFDDTVMTIEYDSEEPESVFYTIRGKLHILPVSLSELKIAIGELSEAIKWT